MKHGDCAKSAHVENDFLQFPNETQMPDFVVLPQTGASGKKQEIWMPDTFFVVCFRIRCNEKRMLIE